MKLDFTGNMSINYMVITFRHLTVFGCQQQNF